MAVYKDSNGVPGKYCGKTHKAWVRVTSVLTADQERPDLGFID